MVTVVNYIQITQEELDYGLLKAEDSSKLTSSLKSFQGIISQTEFEEKITQMIAEIDSLIELKTALQAIQATLP